MAPDDLRALRKELRCTLKELAATLGADADEVTDWERGERFPTKGMVDAMRSLRERGPSAIHRRPSKRASARQDLAAPDALADPSFWALVRKLLAHEALRREAMTLAEPYSDPAQLKTKPSPDD